MCSCLLCRLRFASKSHLMSWHLSMVRSGRAPGRLLFEALHLHSRATFGAGVPFKSLS